MARSLSIPKKFRYKSLVGVESLENIYLLINECLSCAYRKKYQIHSASSTLLIAKTLLISNLISKGHVYFTVPRKITDLSLLTDAPEDSLIVSWFPILCDTVSVNNVYIHSYNIIYCQLDSNNNCVGK